MWFRNLRIYRFKQPFNVTAETLDRALSESVFRPCGPLETHAMGWEPPLGRDGQTLVHAANGCLMVCARREERLLPASVVREVLADRVAEIEEAESREVRRKEQAVLRDQITAERQALGSGPARIATSRSQSAAGDLSVHVGCAKPNGHVGP